MATEIIVPEMGEGVIEVTVARWLKQEGDAVEEFEPILELETDKVTTEAMAETSGTLVKIMVPEGEVAAVGAVLGLIGVAGEPVAATPAAAIQPTPTPLPQPAAPAPRKNGKPAAYSRNTKVGRVSPVVARMAAQHDLDLTQISGSGKHGRITKKDVVAYMERQSMADPTPTPAAVGTPVPAAQPMSAPAPATPVAPAPVVSTSGQIVPLTRMRQLIADHMVMSKRVSPHVTTVHEVDLATVSAHRQANKAAFAAKGARLTFTPYLIAAISNALVNHPMVNSSWHDDGIVLHPNINIGMATAIEEGLIVPVLENCDSYNLLGLSRMVNDLSERARTNRLKPNEVQGGTFSLSNHGVSGSLFATPIINQPQCGILGVGAIQKRVVVVTDANGNDAMAIRPMAYLSFTFDHRILDGATADNFVVDVKRKLEAWS